MINKATYPATGQHETPIVRRVTFSAISCASLGFVTQVLYQSKGHSEKYRSNEEK